ncbi:hypothetical protein ACFV6F_28610, partial [Kitasatospora phosalacinea]
MSALVVPPALLRWISGIDVATAAVGAAAETADAASGGAPVAVPVDEPDHATTLLLRTDRRELVLVGPRTRAAYHLAPPGR